jgi:membrane protease YdiL (CAAX protease family)
MSDNRAISSASNNFAGQVLLVTGTVVATFIAGLVFSWLRLRSRSLIAPILAHIATNGLALLIAWFVAH